MQQLVEAPLAAITWSDHFLYDFQFLMSLWRKIGSHFFTLLLRFRDVCWRLFMHSSFKVLSQHFSRVQVWTLAGTLQNHESFPFQLFCCRFVAVLGRICWDSHSCDDCQLSSIFSICEQSFSLQNDALHLAIIMLIQIMCKSLVICGQHCHLTEHLSVWGYYVLSSGTPASSHSSKICLLGKCKF